MRPHLAEAQGGGGAPARRTEGLARGGRGTVRAAVAGAGLGDDERS